MYSHYISGLSLINVEVFRLLSLKINSDFFVSFIYNKFSLKPSMYSRVFTMFYDLNYGRSNTIVYDDTNTTQNSYKK